jgi:hypothetical protein
MFIKLKYIYILKIIIYKVVNKETNTLALINNINYLINNFKIITRSLIIDFTYKLYKDFLNIS